MRPIASKEEGATHTMKLVLLDRDGVINQDREDSVKSPAELVLLPGVGQAISSLNMAGFYVAVCTNQSIVGRGIITEEELRRIHEAMLTQLAKEKARIHHIFYAPDAPEKATSRRKPGAGMLIEAMTHYHVPAEHTVMVGDNLIDIQAARAAGCHRILVKTGKGAKTLAQGIPAQLEPVRVCADLPEAAKKIREMWK